METQTNKKTTKNVQWQLLPLLLRMLSLHMKGHCTYTIYLKEDMLMGSRLEQALPSFSVMWSLPGRVTHLGPWTL